MPVRHLQPGLERLVPHVAALRSASTCCWRDWRRRWSFRSTPLSAADFATAVIPGWHATIFPPYFVAGAIFSGMAMVLTLMIVARKVMHLEDYITVRHVDAMCKLILATSRLVGLAYGIEFFTAFNQRILTNTSSSAIALLATFGWGYWHHGDMQRLCRSCCGSAACSAAWRSVSCCSLRSMSACGLSASSSSSRR